MIAQTRFQLSGDTESDPKQQMHDENLFGTVRKALKPVIIIGCSIHKHWSANHSGAIFNPSFSWRDPSGPDVLRLSKERNRD